MPDETDKRDVLLHEEELVVDRETGERGSVRIRKVVDTDHVDEEAPVLVEQAEITHVAANEDDSGEVETLPDGTISIPVVEEELVVTRQLVVRERVLVRRVAVEEARRVEADLRRERLEIDGERVD